MLLPLPFFFTGAAWKRKWFSPKAAASSVRSSASQATRIELGNCITYRRWRSGLFVGRFHEQDHIRQARVAVEDVPHADHVVLIVQAVLELDRQPIREGFLGLIERHDLVDDQVRLPAPAVHPAFDVADRIRLDEVPHAGELFRPEDAPHHAVRIFKVEVHIPRVAVAARFFRLGFFDRGDHPGERNLGPVFQIDEFRRDVTRESRELLRMLG